MADLSKAIIKADKAKAKAAKEMQKAAASLREWFRAAREADLLHPNSLEGRDQRLTLAKELDEYALFAEGQLHSRQ
ncbi:hypothetical protein [Aeromonas hydrophila]|uniref:hypothetical protein n=1 Tax=Aeromonas hydrophila TaxID=644 RepID=UPI003EC8972D